MKLGLTGLLLLTLALPVRADLDARELRLAEQLRCVVCQNQTLAESNAPLAADMRREMRTQLQAGHSDEQVLAFFEKRYGSFVRYAPPMRPATWLLWGGPFILGVVALTTLLITLKRRENAHVAETLNDAQRARARQLLQDDVTP